MDPFLLAKLASLAIYPLSFSLILALLALVLFLLRRRRASGALLLAGRPLAHVLALARGRAHLLRDTHPWAFP